jgi:hypothetical protein
MTPISKIHLEILSDRQRALLDKLALLVKDYTLSGGTALAMQLTHRRSYDFDFFSAKPLTRGLLAKLTRVIAVKQKSVDSADELTVFSSSEIKVTFLHYPFANLYPLVRAESGLSLYGFGDIAVQKAYTIGRRGEYRDYFDLYCIIKGGYLSLKEIIAGAQKVYGGIFNDKIFLEQLVYYGDIRDFAIETIGKEAVDSPAKVKQFFERLVKGFVG